MFLALLLLTLVAVTVGLIVLAIYGVKRSNRISPKAREPCSDRLARFSQRGGPVPSTPQGRDPTSAGHRQAQRPGHRGPAPGCRARARIAGDRRRARRRRQRAGPPPASPSGRHRAQGPPGRVAGPAPRRRSESTSDRSRAGSRTRGIGPARRSAGHDGSRPPGGGPSRAGRDRRQLNGRPDRLRQLAVRSTSRRYRSSTAPFGVRRHRRGTPSARSVTTPATTSPAAALSSTRSSTGPRSPASRPWKRAALRSGPPPSMTPSAICSRPASAGVTVSSSTTPPATAQTALEPARVNSSNPSLPCTTQACGTPSLGQDAGNQRGKVGRAHTDHLTGDATQGGTAGRGC